jgi:hypothetical protein
MINPLEKNMKELSSLKKLAEGKGKSNRKRVDEFFNHLDLAHEEAQDPVGRMRTTLQSTVLKDLVKSFGMPVTESKAAMKAAEDAWTAIRSLEGELNDLYMALATAADELDGNGLN